MTRKIVILTLVAAAASWTFSLPMPIRAQTTDTADESGADTIFEQAGLEIPADWDSWDRDTRFQYLQEINIYPPEGNEKYQGEFDVERYQSAQTAPAEPPATSAGQSTEEPSGLTWPTIVIALLAAATSLAYGIRRMNILRKPTVTKWLQLTSYFLLPIGLATATNLLPAASLKPFAMGLGFWTLILLAVILFAKPLFVFSPKCRLFSWIVAKRRELGIAIFYLALFHVLGLFMSTSLWSRPQFWLYDWTHVNFFGTASLAMIFLLYLTSNDFSVRNLRRNWKRLHYLAYPSLLLLLMHKFGREDGLWPAYIIFLVYAAMKGVEFGKALKRRKPKEEKKTEDTADKNAADQETPDKDAADQEATNEDEQKEESQSAQ